MECASSYSHLSLISTYRLQFCFFLYVINIGKHKINFPNPISEEDRIFALFIFLKLQETWRAQLKITVLFSDGKNMKEIKLKFGHHLISFSKNDRWRQSFHQWKIMLILESHIHKEVTYYAMKTQDETKHTDYMHI